MMVLDASSSPNDCSRADARKIDARIFGVPDALHAPHLLDVEVAQVFRRFAARGLVTPSRSTAALRVLDAFPMTRYGHPLLPRSWALLSKLTGYDAAYVALAEALDATLLTRDSRLANAPGHVARVEIM